MSTETHQKTNRLAQESSPYLQQHAHNPVDWYPWGKEALEKASKEGKPIFLSIGYSACHWCHVMERESFESPAVAKLLNENFVSIKVDREERPDLDEIYMAATISITGGGGWPQNVFLTPELKPFFAGTYFPLEDGQGRPGFLTLLTQLSEVWKNNKSELVEQADRVTSRLKRQFKGEGRVLGLEPELLDQAVTDLAQRFDPQNGGFGRAPKFPAPSNVQLLLRYHARSRHPQVLEMAVRTLDGMAAGGIYDHLGGGFARYAVDERWMVPHFEKMLYDNAQMAWLYLEGYQATQSPLYKRVARETLDYLLREMCAPEGGFYSSSDAESEGEEGKFYCWTVEEILEVLGEGPGRNFCAFYGVNSQGNWEGKNVLYVSRPLNQVAAQLGQDAEEFEKELEASRKKLLEARSQRVKPGLDDKIVTAWNGMMIQALAEGYRVLGEARYLEAAKKTAAFLKANLTRGDRLLRSWRAGKGQLNGYLEDYAFLAEGLLSLYEACGEFEYFQWSEALAGSMVEHFAHPEGGFYDTSADHEQLLLRHRNASDGAVPSAQGVAALTLARLAYQLGRKPWREQALGALLSLGKELRGFPAGFCRHLLVLDYCLAGPLEICWSLPAGAGREPMMDALGRLYVPNRAIAWLRAGEEHPQLVLTAGKTVGEQAVVHLCQSGACVTPLSQVEEVVAAVGGLREQARLELHERLPGGATPEATARLAEARPKGYRALGQTGLMVSRLGFGGYRVDDENMDYRAALEAALEGGVNLVDTSSNYTEGGSERLIGGVLRLQPERRAELVVVSKAGYLQGTNLDRARAREQLGHPYAELVTYQDGLWHCIHPDFLEDQLELCCMRLSLEKLDIFLLHNPEYYLLDARQKGVDLKTAREEFERRIEKAFEKLEELAKQGRLGWYGISSNTFAAPDSEYTAVSFKRMVELARKVGGAEHHFAVVQTPLNLLEPEAAEGFSEQVKEAGLGLLINRPLNCFVQQTLVRLADFDSEEDEPNLEKSLQHMGQVEEEYRETFGPFVQGPGSDQLFRFAENMRGLDLHLQNLDHWTQLESRQIRPALLDQIQALDQAMTGAITEPWVRWREKYMAAFRDVSNDLEEVAIRKSQRVAESVAELMPPLPGAGAGASLSQLGAWVVDGVPGVTSVLVGMRQQEYVEDLLPVMGWNACKNSSEVLEALKHWSNPHGVLA
ncbi:MAG: aldo/keto reductase [Vulcanimicrobiota bacterium]